SSRASISGTADGSASARRAWCVPAWCPAASRKLRLRHNVRSRTRATPTPRAADNSWRDEFEAFARAIETRQNAPVTLADAHAALTIVHRVYALSRRPG